MGFLRFLWPSAIYVLILSINLSECASISERKIVAEDQKVPLPILPQCSQEKHAIFYQNWATFVSESQEINGKYSNTYQ